MAEEKPAESKSFTFWMLLLDKILLGGVVVLFAHVLGVSLQEQGKGIDYQQKLFDRRVEVYLEVLQAAEKARDELRLYWSGDEADEATMRLNQLESRFKRLFPNRDGFAGSSSYSTPDSVIALLRTVQERWKSQSIYFSAEVSEAVTSFVLTSSVDLEKRLTWIESRKAAATTNENPVPEEPKDSEAWQRASDAFDRLNKTLRQRLKLDGIILG